MRRALLVIAIVVVLLGGGVWAYFSFFASAPGIAVAPAGSATLPSAGQTNAPGTAFATAAATSSPTPVSARLVKISAGPVVPGEAVVDLPAANASSSPDVAVHYIERQSGNVFSYSERTGILTRTSNRTIPGIEMAAWLPDASAAFVRYLSGDSFGTVNTYALPADGSSGFFLPQDLADVAVSSSSVLVLASGVNGSSASVMRADGTHTAQVFTTPLSSLRVSFAGKGRYLAFTKPSAALAGDAFIVDGTGRFTRIAGPLNGLVALASPSGTLVLVSSVAGGVMRMELVNTSTGEATGLPVATLADKCAWTADSSALYCAVPQNPPLGYAYPDDWYQGAVSFSDSLWKINVTGRYAEFVLDLAKETGSPVDAEALAVDPGATTLVFVDKNDGALWSYAL